MWITILVLIYLVIAYLAYKYIISEWKQPTWEKVMLSLSWILILPLWGIYKLHFLF